MTRKFISGYLGNYWNYIDWTFVMSVAYFCYRYWGNHKTLKNWQPHISSNPTCEQRSLAFVEGTVWQNAAQSYSWQLAIIFCVTVWRTLKYLQISPALLVSGALLLRPWLGSVHVCSVLVLPCNIDWQPWALIGLIHLDACFKRTNLTPPPFFAVSMYSAPRVHRSCHPTTHAPLTCTYGGNRPQVPFSALERSAKESLAFCVVFFILLLGFAWIFHCM